MKKAVSLMMAAAMTMGLAACGSTASTDTAASAADTASSTEAAASTADSTAAADGKVYNIGICQLVQHEALDAATQGFKDALVEKLGEGSVKFDEQNASGDSANCATIVNGFVSNGVDLILANATAPLQAAAQATADIPVLGTSITDYATALDISDWTGTVGNNISGTSDLAPLDQQAAMIQELFPDAKSVGLFYCSAEPNSVYQCDVIEGYLTEEGYTVARYAFTDTNDVTSVAQTAADNSDVIYIPTDNTAASNTEAIANVVIPAKVPVVAGEEGICSGCGVATLSISYYDLGYATGEMAAKILADGADVSAMPVEFAPNVTKKYNAANCEALGITPPMRKSDVHPGQLRDLLEWRYPETAWVECGWRGMTLLIRVVDGVPAGTPLSETGAGDVVAARDGIVDSIRTKAGTALVQPGDVVRKGQILIRGEERTGSGVRAVSARGVVMARVWDAAAVRMDLTELHTSYSGRTEESVSVVSPWFALWHEPESEFHQADVSRRTLPLGGFFLPLTCVWEKRYECEITKQNRANEEITAEASIAALRKLREIIGTNESLVDKWVNCSMIDHEVLLAVATGERLVDIAEQIPSGAPDKGY